MAEAVKREQSGAKRIEVALRKILRRRGYRTERQVSVLFTGFDTAKLLDANTQSHNRVFEAASAIAIEHAIKREKKLKTPKNPILGTDLIPALDFDELKKRDSSLANFWSMFSESCPWCD
jgi:hypothetical protein